jgi:hypothetical protein
MNTCPCCSNALLRHIKHGSLSWFCRSCWLEMPNLEEEIHAASTVMVSRKTNLLTDQLDSILTAV